ncbi:MAG: NUDIX domain-containing protein [Geosporobacter ferrireducens]|nr:NUDIX domain-containing protein [Geosporobacter ferrireducens]
MMVVNFHEIGSIKEARLKFVVIPARYKNKWIFVRHKNRETWEMPGGHIEAGECIIEAARRELFEESGAVEFEVEPLCDYSVSREDITTYGRLFISNVTKLGPLPETEIGEVRLFDDIPESLTYPAIQGLLFKVLEK